MSDAKLTPRDELAAELERLLAKVTPGPWCVDETKALGAYGVWTDYATRPGHDGAGYGTQICSMIPADINMAREQRDANAAFITFLRNNTAAILARLREAQ